MLSKLIRTLNRRGGRVGGIIKVSAVEVLSCIFFICLRGVEGVGWGVCISKTICLLNKTNIAQKQNQYICIYRDCIYRVRYRAWVR